MKVKYTHTHTKGSLSQNETVAPVTALVPNNIIIDLEDQSSGKDGVGGLMGPDDRIRRC